MRTAWWTLPCRLNTAKQNGAFDCGWGERSCCSQLLDYGESRPRSNRWGAFGRDHMHLSIRLSLGLVVRYCSMTQDRLTSCWFIIKDQIISKHDNFVSWWLLLNMTQSQAANTLGVWTPTVQYIRTPLINAAIAGKAAVVKLLLSKKACVEARDKVKMVRLHTIKDRTDYFCHSCRAIKQHCVSRRKKATSMQLMYLLNSRQMYTPKTRWPYNCG